MDSIFFLSTLYNKKKKKIRHQFLAKRSSEYVLLTGVVYYISHAHSVGM